MLAAACTDHVQSGSSSGLTPTASSTTTTTTRPRRSRARCRRPGRLGVEARVRRASSRRHARRPRWATCYYWSATTCTNTSTGEFELYTPDNVSVAAGTLRLTARREAVFDDGKRYGYTSGMVSGATPDRTLFAFRYGYVRRAPGSRPAADFWSAFWLLPARRDGLPEIDVFENVGYQPNVVLQFTHCLAANGPQQFGNGVAVARVGRRLARLRPRLGADVAHLVRRRPQGLDDGQPRLRSRRRT